MRATICEATGTADYVLDAFTSIATLSQSSPPPLAVQLQVTEPDEARTLELEAPVIAFGTLTFHSCAQVGPPRVTPPHIDGESMTQLLGYFVAIDIAGLLGEVLWPMAVEGIGFAWSTPEKEYAPTTAEVGPASVTTMFPVPLGLTKYQNSASLL